MKSLNGTDLLILLSDIIFGLFLKIRALVAFISHQFLTT